MSVGRQAVRTPNRSRTRSSQRTQYLNASRRKSVPIVNEWNHRYAEICGNTDATACGRLQPFCVVFFSLA